ncbi:MAG: recombinase family protein [bacterium]|nr:recombinase family protein [bacterium]
MKAIILARESDKNQDSNDAQLFRMGDYIKSKGLDEWKTFKLKESSTKGYRKKFQEIIEEVKKSKEIIAIVVDTVDRLQRGFRESVIFDELRKEGKVELHFYRENLVINKKSNSSDIMRWDMAVMFAKSYVLQLSDNLKRKHDKMREDGEITGAPPIGYKSIYNDNPLRVRRVDVVPDDKAHLIVRIYEEYAKGDVSVNTLADRMYALGFRSKINGKVNHAMIFKILNDTFYYGYAYSRTHDLRYRHGYKPIISKALFDKCQAVMERHNKVPTKYASKPFVFRGLIVCGKCGGVVGGQLKKGKYAYYSCSGFKDCKREYVPEVELLKQVYGVLDGFKLSDQMIEEITEGLKQIGENENRFYRKNVTALKTEHDKYEARIKKMYEDKLDGRITDEMYDSFLREYKEKQAELFEQMQDHSDADEQFYLTANMTLNIAKRAKEIFMSSEVEEKRQFLGFLLQNCELNEKTLGFTLRSPFNLMLNQPDSITVRRG